MMISWKWNIVFLLLTIAANFVASSQVDIGIVKVLNDTTDDSWILLSAPWTPFSSNLDLNPSKVKDQAKFHKSKGVTHVWAIGGMGQWSQLTMPERKSLAQAWVTYGKMQGLYVIIHVGSQCIYDAKELAKHAEQIGADAIAVLPPWAPSRPKDLDTLVVVLAEIANTVKLPFWYYHLPGQTGLNYKMSDLLTKSKGIIPTFAGIKYVSNDLEDFQLCMQIENGKYKRGMLWAPEPKLQALPFGTTGFVLAEAYYAPYLLKVLNAYRAGEFQKAQQAQESLNNLQSLIQGEGGKAVMKMLGIDLGGPRLPNLDISQAEYEKLYLSLQEWGFFNQTL